MVQQLSGLDAAFLYLETPQMPMHVGALHTFSLPPGYAGDFVADVRRHLRERAHLAPPLGRKLLPLPMNLATPAWTDASVDFDWHVIGLKLPRLARGSTGMAEAQALVSRLHSHLLDRDRPMWRFHVLTGFKPLPDGSPVFGLYTQLHHAAVDGQAAVALGQAILDLSADGRAINMPSERPASVALGMAERLGGALAHQMKQIADLAKALPGTATAVGKAAGQVAASGAKDAMLDAARKAASRWVEVQDAKGRKLQGGMRNLKIAPRTVFNVTVGRRRAFAAVSLSMAELKVLRTAFEATLNDVVLAVCSGALRRYLQARKALPKESLIAAVPISLRAAGDTSASNQASMSVVSLGTHLAAPARRVAHVKAATAAMKSALVDLKSVMPTDFPTLGVPWLLTGMVSLYGRTRLADRIPPIANVTISNVPGPAVPLYLAGAKMLSNHPTSIVVHGVALNITVQSYNGALEFGAMACAKAMPDVALFAQALHESHAELLALAHKTLARSAAKQAATKATKATKAPAGKVAKKAAAKTVRKTPAKVAAKAPLRKPRAPATASRTAR
ncbi:wax ester/triacylglycerol synthase family O-acyltransferase [uncultured Methylibium sp.]|uniref:wax ester/triacylglycerol synthase family O-acyltransferase n=1 Tax=uncultured Methylibium sp. TaxID=381093 RepID=UPI0025D5CC2B|nr:wax ester/triacylglycerol synthase family O-acyltransferase [uncultured Methylibium sp.]